MSSRKKKELAKPSEKPKEFAAKTTINVSGADWISYFILFALAATWSTFYNGIWDCDESMNYFEPLHQLLFGYGFQTWEYSPTYALRSYFYLLAHIPGAFLSAALSFVTSTPLSKIAVFYSIRWFLGMIGALCNTYLTVTVHRRFGVATAQSLQVFLFITPGMFISSTSFLPSTLAMYCYTVMLAAWMNEDLIVALHLVAFAALVGWPFSVLVGVPLAIYILVNRGILFALTHGIISLVIFLGPAIAIDSQFYGKIVAAPLNILLYNVFGGAGPELYGVEPWYYYLVNGFLNFNFILVLALACPLLLVLHAWKSGRWAAAMKTLIYISGTFLWLGYMSFIPHKEERFLFVIYPWICFAAALSLTCISSMFESWPKFIGTILALILLVIVALSVSRSASLYFNYEAPTSVYTYLYYKETAERDTTIELVSTPMLNPEDIQRICVGKEWYRFPTHFFLPPHLRVTFIRDGFDGQLPQYYGPGPDSFSRTPENFNDLNKEEISRYGKLDDCKYWINFFEDDAAYTNFLESANGSVWREEYKAPFLSASRSTNPLFRAFYVPGYSEEHNLFGHYVLLERKTNDTTQEQTP